MALADIKNKLSAKDLATHFLQETSNNTHYEEAIKIVGANSLGKKVWASGGLVYRNIIKSLYKRQDNETYDFDFILESLPPFTRLSVPIPWQLFKTGLGGPRLINGLRKIDLILLDDAATPTGFHPNLVTDLTADEKLKRYFYRVPLTVQAIVFDIQVQQIIGETGINAILEKRIAVNDLHECLCFCRRRRISIRNFMSRKGNELHFSVDYPNLTDSAKSETVSFYETYSTEYSRGRGSDRNTFITRYLKSMVELFLKKLSGKRLLDLGSGPGRDAIFFRERGLEPVCVDISPAMVKLCRQNRLIAYQMDIEDLRFTDKSFTGAWAYTSLVHIPKARIHNTLARISELLKPRGLFYAGMIEGKGEILYQSPRLPHKRRFYALYTNREFRKILSDYFDVIAYKRIVTPKGEVYLNYLCQKPEHEFVYPTLH